MSENENSPTKLLARFTELAPAEWGISPTGADSFHMTDSDGYINGVHLNNDLFGDTPEIIIRLWDYIIEKEYPHTQLRDTRMTTIPGTWEFNLGGYATAHPGKTRIEAVVRACVALWEQAPKEEEK